MVHQHTRACRRIGYNHTSSGSSARWDTYTCPCAQTASSPTSRLQLWTQRPLFWDGNTRKNTVGTAVGRRRSRVKREIVQTETGANPTQTRQPEVFAPAPGTNTSVTVLSCPFAVSGDGKLPPFRCVCAVSGGNSAAALCGGDAPGCPPRRGCGRARGRRRDPERRPAATCLPFLASVCASFVSVCVCTAFRADGRDTDVNHVQKHVPVGVSLHSLLHRVSVGQASPLPLCGFSRCHTHPLRPFSGAPGPPHPSAAARAGGSRRRWLWRRQRRGEEGKGGLR